MQCLGGNGYINGEPFYYLTPSKDYLMSHGCSVQQSSLWAVSYVTRGCMQSALARRRSDACLLEENLTTPSWPNSALVRRNGLTTACKGSIVFPPGICEVGLGSARSVSPLFVSDTELFDGSADTPLGRNTTARHVYYKQFTPILNTSLYLVR